MLSIITFISFLALAILGLPIAHALIVGAQLGLLPSERLGAEFIVQQLVTQTQSFPLIAIPFFMLTGSLMVGGKLGQHLIALLTTLMGRFHGGPAQVGVLSSTIFGGVSGSAVADASAIGSLLIPWLKKMGYPPAFAAGTLAAAATIDILIPPSIPMIIYALVSNASIGALFVAGILPGLVMCAGFMLVCYVQGRRRGFPRDMTPFEWGRFRAEMVFAVPALALPLLIIIFLRFGIATPTEVSVMSTLYAFVVSVALYRDLTFARLKHSIVDAGVASPVVMLIINLSIGLYHPPVGTTLFITSSIAQVKMGKVVIELIPFYFVAIGILLLFSFVPALTLRI